MSPARPSNTGTPERLAALRLIRSENIGPVIFRQLLDRYETATAALEALPELSRRGGRRIRVCPAGRAEAELNALAKLSGDLLVLGDPDYPEALAAIPDAPPVVCLLGQRERLETPTVAIVGARNASSTGRRFAREIARDLTLAGYQVVSGLARGIDTAAHRGALESPAPHGTVAVLAGGVDVVYPEENRDLYRAVAADGLAVSEMPLGTVPQARHFPRRNRIISGIARGVVVVEAAPRSGSLITARYAADQGREVFAVPGSPYDPRARGCNNLLRDNAVVTESAADVVSALQGMLRPPEPILETPLFQDSKDARPADDEVAAARDRIAELLGPSPAQVDELIRQCQVSPAVVQQVLLELELAGRVERHPGNRIALAVPGA